ncbi:DNA-binding protein [Salinisphaera hydrothermalis]|uniref:DNA-binding protein n=1 Tax=Salinisphaera hydrothermalis TaxID=563188 RepID=UPI00334190DA
MDLASAQKWFRDNGVPVSAWADARGFARQTVYAVLAGRSPAIRGEAHRVAVALGLKPAASVAARSPHTDPIAYAGPAGHVDAERRGDDMSQ